MTGIWLRTLARETSQRRSELLTACEPAKAHRALPVRPSKELVVNESREQGATVRGGRILGGEELGKEFHVVELALDGVREHDICARDEHGCIERMVWGREGAVENLGKGGFFDPDEDVGGLKGRV